MSLLQQQKNLLLACIGTAVLVGVVMYFVLSPSKSEAMPQVAADQIKTPGSTVQSNEVWMQQINQEAKIQNKKIEILENLVQKQVGAEPGENEDLTKLKQEISDLKKQFIETKQGKTDDENSVGVKAVTAYLPLVKHGLKLQGSLYKVNDRIPPGSYVKAVLLSAVDVGVGVNVSADPQPVVMRLLGEGILPNNACSHLKRCHIVGSAVGDLSSERAFIRLEKLSCVDIQTQNITETDVSGYVTGEDGKNGLAGVVVDRSGRMISGAVLVGLISGVSSVVQSFAASKSNDNMLSKLGDRGVQNNVLSSEFIKGSTQGTAGAFDKLARLNGT